MKKIDIWLIASFAALAAIDPDRTDVFFIELAVVNLTLAIASKYLSNSKSNDDI